MLLFILPFYKIKNFQRENNLKRDGICGPRTYSRLAAKRGRALEVFWMHCSATKLSSNVTAESIVNYHTKTLGWSRPGYNLIVETDGKVVVARNFDLNDTVDKDEFVWGVYTLKNGSIRILNKNAFHICTTGGLGEDGSVLDTRTAAQMQAQESIVKFMLALYPNILFAGHNQVQIKGCPSYNASQWLAKIGVPEYNILQVAPLVIL